MTARLVFNASEIEPAALEERVRRAAGALERLGVRQGDVVCILLHNGPAFLEAQLAARLLGAYWCPINWHYKADEAGWILRDSGAKVLVTDDALRAQAGAGIPPGLPVVNDWKQFLDGQVPWKAEERRPGTLMPYTSGTTGRAKGIRRLPQTPEQLAQLQQGMRQVLGIEPGMRALHPAPLYHSAPSSYAVQAALHGELLVLEERFDAERALSLIERHRLTHAYLVPTMYVRLLRLSEAVKRRYDLSSMLFVASTGSPCPAEVKRAMIDWWGPVFNESYAASELGYVTSIGSEEALRKPGAAGRPVGAATLRILDESGRELPRGEVGLIYARQPAYPDFTYNNNPEARRTIERDGLLSLGDMGFIDDDGYLYVCDRASDMVISGGVNIYPAEIEAVLTLMPGVRDCAVFGIPDEEFGEALAAAVQTEAGSLLQSEDVRRYLQEKIANYKVPKVVTFHAELPREESGKIFKRRLRAPYWEKTGRRI
ncbi:MAG TPA: AMP-binding protein [Burkholderiales bacterium]|jgi:long-chain acyl-CoA synthetase|nr:AMP-binding protein [Burkholderiales bacterium]